METTDDQLDATSQRLLTEIDEMKRLEVDKRHSARSSDEFHELAERVDSVAQNVFRLAHDELVRGEHDSPLEAERKEQHPGDWTDRDGN